MAKVQRRKKTSKRASSPGNSGGIFGWFKKLFIRLLLLALVLAFVWVFYLDVQIRKRFTSERWTIPAHVYSNSFTLAQGQRLNAKYLLKRLRSDGYQAAQNENQPGTFSVSGNNTVEFVTRAFTDYENAYSSARIRVSIENEQLVTLQINGKTARGRIKLAPRLIGSLTPSKHKDRSLLKLHDAPEHLIKALFAIEDKRFLEHFGVDPKGLARAMFTNVKRGALVQGGSTLTQQLVKNIFLSSERTFKRKFTEMVMALLLELHYEKHQILEAYLNEIFLGQSGNRAIHGFALASEYFFARPLRELKVQEIALLVGMIKAPSFYNPARHPERAAARRNLVLNALVTEGHLTKKEYASLKGTGIDLKITRSKRTDETSGYLDLVRSDMDSLFTPELAETNGDEGLKVFSTLDNYMQETVATALSNRLSKIEKARKLPANSLQGAVVVVQTNSGEVLALVGGRSRTGVDFNRALEAYRPVGSLLKPVVYLTALQQPERFNLLSPLQDEAIEIKLTGSPVWKPQNYDKQFHGEVTLLEALTKSYNLATVSLGEQLGIDSVINTLHRVGIERTIPPFPSLYLGASSHNVLEMAQLYQTIANGGRMLRLRSLRAIDGAGSHTNFAPQESLSLNENATALTQFAMQQVAKTGTAQALAKSFPGIGVAGKTGTTDDFRDSWFAGFAGNLLTVVWLGRDDNKPTGLTGASGALQVWRDIMQELPLAPLSISSPGIEWVEIEPISKLLGDKGCEKLQSIPFIIGSGPTDYARCTHNKPDVDSIGDWIRSFTGSAKTSPAN